MSRQSVVALLGILCAASGCPQACTPDPCADGVWLEFPCAAIASVETHGAACGETDLSSEATLHIDGKAAGTCSFTVVTKSGERYDFTADLRTPPGCSPYDFAGLVNEPIPQLCPDGGANADASSLDDSKDSGP